MFQIWQIRRELWPDFAGRWKRDIQYSSTKAGGFAVSWGCAECAVGTEQIDYWCSSAGA